MQKIKRLHEVRGSRSVLGFRLFRFWSICIDYQLGIYLKCSKIISFLNIMSIFKNVQIKKKINPFLFQCWRSNLGPCTVLAGDLQLPYTSPLHSSHKFYMSQHSKEWISKLGMLILKIQDLKMVSEGVIYVYGEGLYCQVSQGCDRSVTSALAAWAVQSDSQTLSKTNSGSFITPGSQEVT